MKRMRKTSIFLAGYLFALFSICPGLGHAAEATKTAAASVTVNPVFSITAVPLNLNFGNVDVEYTPDTPVKDFQVNISNNHNNPWGVTIKTLTPLTSGAYTIPNENFTYWGYGGTGTWDLGPGHLETDPVNPFYTPLSTDRMTDPTTLTLQFVVNIPLGQAAGVYTTSILLTMKDQSTDEEIEQIVYASVGIPPVFSISAEPPAINFGTTNPGATTETKNLYLSCLTNNENPWNVSMRVVSELTAGVYTVPNENFHWRQEGSLNGSGTWYAGTGYLDTLAYKFYDSGPGEDITISPVELLLELDVAVPANQTRGTYTTTLIVTMSE